MNLSKKLQNPIFEIETLESINSSHLATSAEQSQMNVTAFTLKAMKTIHDAFLPPLTCEKIDAGFHYYKDKHNGDLECFEVESEKVLSRIVFQERDNILTIYNLKEKRASKELDVSYRSRLSPLEAKEKIDEFLNKIKELVGYKNLEEDERILNLRLSNL